MVVAVVTMDHLKQREQSGESVGPLLFVSYLTLRVLNGYEEPKERHFCAKSHRMLSIQRALGKGRQA